MRRIYIQEGCHEMTAQKSFAVIKPKFNGFVPGALKSWQGSSTGRLNWILIILALLIAK